MSKRPRGFVPVPALRGHWLVARCPFRCNRENAGIRLSVAPPVLGTGCSFPRSDTSSESRRMCYHAPCAYDGHFTDLPGLEPTALDSGKSLVSKSQGDIGHVLDTGGDMGVTLAIDDPRKFSKDV